MKTIASLVDGRVVPWFADGDPIPEKFVAVPDALLAKYKAGEITDGRALARASLAANAEVGPAHQNVATPPPKKAGGDADPGAVDPAAIERGEPTSPEVTHASTRRRA